MKLFASLLKKKKSESVVLIDIGASSMAGACALYTEGELPTVLYTQRLAINVREGEPHEAAMIRALATLCEALVREGSPTLLRASGSGSVNTIVVSIDAPWQETRVHTEFFEKKPDFIFTKSMVTRALKHKEPVVDRKTITDESIIGTIVNGYETRNPYGKKVHRASAVILTSLIDESVAYSITTLLRSAYHTKNILPITDSSLRYQAIGRAFAHEHNFLIIDAMSPETHISLVRRNLFIGIVGVPEASESSEWTTKITTELSELAERYPLPRTIFIIAPETEAATLQKKLSDAKLGSLWLSDNPPTIVAVLASHLTTLVRHSASTPPDLPLLLMALYYQHRSQG